MAKVQFSTPVKYKDTLIPAYTPFEVDSNDLEMVVKAGCHVLENSTLTDTDEKVENIKNETKDMARTTRSRRARR